MPATDPYNLERFVAAQRGAYDEALAEIRAGRKRSHWMWFVFPQIAGLGQSATSRFYAVAGLDEARAYLRHPLLGPRLVECAEALLALAGRSARDVFGVPDDVKLRSSMTLFELAEPERAVFGAVIDKYFHGDRDERTTELAGRPRTRR
jgi:uncharacterized protein (DUF1810 family)